MNRREYDSSIDFIKIVSCFLVVALHTLKANIGVINYIVFQIAIISVPTFFVVNGYLLFRKDEVSYKYVFIKIYNILRICLSWELMHACAYYMYYHEVRDFLQSFCGDFLQKGLFYHFWFFGALIVLYLIFPVIHSVYKNNWKLYMAILSGLGILCIGIHMGQLILQERYVLKVIQTFRVWVWLFYFMIGGWLYGEKKTIKKVTRVKPVVKCLGLVVMGISLIIWEYGMGMRYFDSCYMSEAYHGALVTIIVTVVVFCIMSQFEISSTNSEYIHNIAKTTMGIYIIHPFILALLEKKFPIMVQNAWMNILFWIATSLISMGIVFFMSKVPVLKSMIEL